MELEFDKEMDALLRRGRAAPASAALNGHPDPDVVAAYVENALPPTVRSIYTRHFADCDKCRRQLSFAIDLHTDAIPEAAPTP